MKTTIAAIVVISIMTACLIGCIYKIPNTTWKYDTAITCWTTWKYDTAVTHLSNGSMKTIKIKSLRDYEDEQIRVTDHDGNVYILNSFNTFLIRTN